MTPCPCHSGLSYANCCQPFIDNQQSAHTPERLMRSRFSAFCRQEWAYILQTWHPDYRPNCTSDELAAEAAESQWVSLTVLASGQDPVAVSGWVDFCAWYRDAEGLHLHHELSSFVREQDKWFYTTGKFLPAPSEFKLKSNMPCPCGSELKYKKCCGTHR